MFLGEMENKQGFKPFAADNSDNCFPEAPEFWGSTTFHSPLKKINTQATSPPIASLGSWRQPPPGRGISRAAAPAFVVVTSTLTAYHEDKPQCSLQTVDVPLLWSTGASGRKRKTGNQWATHMAKPSPNKHDYFGDLRSLTHPQIENYLMCYPSGPCPDVGKPCVFELKVLSLNFQPWLLNLTRTIAGHIMKFISAVANHDCQTQLISSSSLSAWSLEKSPTIPTQTTPTIRVSNFFGARNPGSLISRWISPWVVEKNHWSGPVRQRRLHHFLLKTWPQIPPEGPDSPPKFCACPDWSGPSQGWTHHHLSIGGKVDPVDPCFMAPDFHILRISWTNSKFQERYLLRTWFIWWDIWGLICI